MRCQDWVRSHEEICILAHRAPNHLITFTTDTVPPYLRIVFPNAKLEEFPRYPAGLLVDVHSHDSVFAFFPQYENTGGFMIPGFRLWLVMPETRQLIMETMLGAMPGVIDFNCIVTWDPVARQQWEEHGWKYMPEVTDPAELLEREGVVLLEWYDVNEV